MNTRKLHKDFLTFNIGILMNCEKYIHNLSKVGTRGVHISMGKFQSVFLKKHIAVPGCILLPENKYVRVEHFDPGK